MLSARVKFLGIGRNIVEKVDGSGGIRTHASEETGALNQRLRPLGHATLLKMARERKVKVEHCLLRGLNSRPLVYKTSALPLS